MGKAEEYRRYARQCLEIAPAFQDEEGRATLLGLAQAWLRLAHLAQANRHIADLAVQIVRQRSIVKHARDTGGWEAPLGLVPGSRQDACHNYWQKSQ